MEQVLVLNIEQLTKTKVKVCLDNRTDFQLYKSELKKFNIELNAEVDYDMLLESLLIPRAKKRAMHLLEKMDKTRNQLESKLIQNGYPKEAIDAALEYVESYKYIDDKRYAYSYVRYYKEFRSVNRIRNDLMSKGIKKDIITSALEEEYDVDERELINKLILKKGYDFAESDKKEKDKLIRFLVSRGFCFDDILSVFNNYKN